LKAELSALMPILKEKYHVEAIEIFGSYARGEQSQKSDLDLLITFSKPYSLWDLLDVKEFLTAKLRFKVDLVPKDSIKPLIKEQITQEAIPV
jgi:uncharacterized protein